MKHFWITKVTVEELTKELVSFDSVSHRSNRAISERVAEILQDIGFEVEWIEYNDVQGVGKVSLVCKRDPQTDPKTTESDTGGVAYMAHTDVVPVDDWDTGFSGPFEAVERSNRLYGRGTCDMKGSLASAIKAVSRIDRQEQKKPIYFVVSSDEEVGMEGAKHIDKRSKYFQEMVNRGCVGIIGEPTELQVVRAHKGTLGYIIRSKGISAHTSTGEGTNANYALIPILPKLLELREMTERDPAYHNQAFDPPTLSWNMVLRNEPLAVNVTTALAEAVLFLRPMPGVNDQPIVDAIHSLCKEHQLELIEKGRNKPWEVAAQADWIQKMLQIVGGTSAKAVCYATDGGVLQRLERMVVCGPGSIDQAHRKDEWVSIDQLNKAVAIYERAFRDWATV